jgi:hypothetical protein
MRDRSHSQSEVAHVASSVMREPEGYAAGRWVTGGTGEPVSRHTKQPERMWVWEGPDGYCVSFDQNSCNKGNSLHGWVYPVTWENSEPWVGHPKQVGTSSPDQIPAQAPADKTARQVL